MFDARAAKMLSPGERIILDDCPGLRLECTTRGRAWIYRFKSPIDGLMKQMKLGQWPALSVSAAVDAWNEAREIRSAGRDPSAEKKEKKKVERDLIAQKKQSIHDVYTVQKLVDQYYEGHIIHARKEKGRKEVRWFFDNRLDKIAHLPADSVTRAIAFEFIESMLATPVQAKRLKVELAAAWDYALDAGRLPPESPNWWRLIMRRKIRSKGAVVRGQHRGTEKRVLSDADLSALLQYLPNFSETVRDLLTMYLWTGARGSELIQMMGSEVTREQDGLWWTLPKEKTKNARHANATDLRVPLIGRALEIVERRIWLYADGYLFPSVSSLSKSPHVEQKVVGCAIWLVRESCTCRPNLVRPRLKIPDWSAHDLRRTVRTMLAAIGCPDEVAEAVLGHMPAGIKGVYNRHSYDKERRFWLSSLDQKLEGLSI